MSLPPTEPGSQDHDQDDPTLDSQTRHGGTPVNDPVDQTRDSIHSHSESAADDSKTGRSKHTAHTVDETIASVGRADPHDQFDENLFLSQTKKRADCPEKIGRYDVKRLLGEGAFGRVYEAHDPQLERLVAIKVAKTISSATQVKRFVREARAAAQLRHPNIIPVYEYGLVDDQNIIVYEFVAGETLKSFIKRRTKIELSEAIEIVRQIAEGLSYAHEQGIIHRDMKPDNVLIDTHGHPHIADFGCARSLEDETNLTIDGSILGTPMYMSPEQASGNSSTADGRTDIWSLGVMLYELVVGEKPFGGSLNDLLFTIVNHDPPPMRKVRPGTPLDIETIGAKCLSRDLAGRFSTADLLAEELARYQRGEPILSRRIGVAQRTWLWAKRNRAVASLLGVVAVTLLMASIVSSLFALDAYRERRQRAFTQLMALKTSDSSALPGIFADLKPFRATVLPQIKEQLNSEEITPDERHRLRMAVLELEEDPLQRQQLAEQMIDDLLVSDPGDFFVCRTCLEFRKGELTSRLWKTGLDSSGAESNDRRFRAAAALALYDPESAHWSELAPDVAGYLISLNPIEMSHWLPSLTPIRESLKPELLDSFHIADEAFTNVPSKSAMILSLMFNDQPTFLVDLVSSANSRQLSYLTGALKVNRTLAIEQLLDKLDAIDDVRLSTSKTISQKSNLIIGLIQLEAPHPWYHFQMDGDPSVVTELIERLGPAATPFELLLPQIMQWARADSDALAGILLASGQFQPDQILDSRKQNLRSVLLEIFSEHPNARVHSSARWLLEKWGFAEPLLAREKQLRREVPDPTKDWHVDLAGNTFALLGPVDSFEMGFDPTANQADFQFAGFDPTGVKNEPWHRKKIPRRFGICIHEVTIVQFEKFEDELIEQLQKQVVQLDAQLSGLALVIEADGKTNQATEDSVASEASTDAQQESLVRAKRALQARLKEIDRARNRRAELASGNPVGEVDYFLALAYCRWLSEQQQISSGLPTIQRLREYYDNSKTDLPLTESNLSKPGYRLPTATEWEYAYRGKSLTLFPFGQRSQYGNRYGWFATNSESSTHTIGQLKPGMNGLFDMGGNVREWCLDWYREDLPVIDDAAGRDFYVDFGPEFERHQNFNRECRGASFKDEILDLRSTCRFSSGPILGQPYLGFRLARTY